MSQQPRVTDSVGSSAEVTRGSSIRPLARIFGEATAVWAFSGDGRLAFVSAGCARWLNASADDLVGRTGLPRADGSFAEPLDAVVFSLRPALPPQSSASDIATRAAFVSLVTPAAVTSQSQAEATNASESRRTIFVPIADDSATAYLAIAGTELHREPELASAQFRALMDALQQQLAAEPRLLFTPLMLGGSVWAERLKRQVRMAAQSTAHVTIRCPQGGGGESLAKLIHSQRTASEKRTASDKRIVRTRELIKVAGSLMDAELFDATTGGLVNQLLDDPSATAQLLVLDIDEMPHEAQERLALLLHNHGERLRVFVTTRLAASELTVKLLTDLASQLGLIEIYMPALSERIEDLPMMAAAMLQRRHAASETTARQIGRETLDRMILYPWPGNYEELDAAIRNAARQCRGETIHVEHLPLAIKSFGGQESSPADVEARNVKIVPLDQALADAERRFIQAALEKAGGNRAAAARLLDVSRGRLLRRIEQLGIDADG